MERIFHRLTISFSLIAFLVFGSLAGYWQYVSTNSQSTVTRYYELLNQVRASCSQDKTWCESIPRYQREFDEAVKLRNECADEAKVYVKLALGAPLITLLLYFWLRWALIGKLPNIPLRKSIHIDSMERSQTTNFLLKTWSVVKWSATAIIIVGVVVLAMLKPGRTMESFISSAVQAIGIAGIAGLIYLIQNKKNGKKPGDPPNDKNEV